MSYKDNPWKSEDGTIIFQGYVKVMWRFIDQKIDRNRNLDKTPAIQGKNFFDDD